MLSHENVKREKERASRNRADDDARELNKYRISANNIATKAYLQQATSNASFIELFTHLQPSTFSIDFSLEAKII